MFFHLGASRRLAAGLLASATLAACAPEPPKASDGNELAQAVVETQASVSVCDPWIAATSAGSSVAAGYFIVSNATASADRLVAAESSRAQRIEIHEMKMDGEMMRMRAVAGVDVPARGAAVLSPGGYHLMLIGIDRPFIEGEFAPMALIFERAGRIDVQMRVRARAKAAADAAAGGAHDGH